ncbi:NUDIX hydrolase [Paenibacillus fonticola]|uniref:NUDIX hydrolase n=1 Tax=Paenibacillus fonticola TaxID=379896 RepID=UPI000382290E|nr:NUDIX domain-containing protein [Paenibacillus fonticola]
MQTELLNIYDENRVHIGVATRADVHQLGYWHESIHCWFVSHDENEDYIYFQLRSEHKRDYPNLLDITAAGHLLSHETVGDGIREIKEETGIEVSMSELISLGIMNYVVTNQAWIDKEIAYVFLYRCELSFDDFSVQQDEVSGIFRARFNDFVKLWLGQQNQIDIHGFQLDDDGQKRKVKQTVGRNQFVPHDESFYQAVLHQIKEVLQDTNPK